MGFLSELERAFGLKGMKRRKRREGEAKHKRRTNHKRARKANGEFKKRTR